MWNDGGCRYPRCTTMPLPVAGLVVARRAENIEALLAPVEIRRFDLERQLLHRRSRHLAGEERLVFLQRPARDGALDQRTAHSSRRRTAGWRAAAGTSAGCACPAGMHRRARERKALRAPTPRAPSPATRYGSISLTSFAPSPCRNARVFSRSNFESSASIARKNPSWLACSANRFTLNTG